MGKTPIIIQSRHDTSTAVLRIDYNEANEGKLTVAIDELTGAVVDITISELVEKLNLIPGLSVSYVEPIKVPTYIGAAVIRSVMGSPDKFERFVRYAEDSEHSLPWISKTGNRYSNDDIAAVLANHGYEAQPQFPRQGED